MKLLFAILALSLSCFAQTAKVIALDPADAAEAKRLADARASILKQESDFDLKIQRKYTMHETVYPTTGCISSIGVTHDGVLTSVGPKDCTPPKPTPEQEAASHYWIPMKGWEVGIQFSEDYKFIVPATYTPPKLSLGCGMINYVNPAVIAN